MANLATCLTSNFGPFSGLTVIRGEPGPGNVTCSIGLELDNLLYKYNNLLVGNTNRGRPLAVKHPQGLHNRIPVLRAERGLSRQELAQAVGVNYQTIGYLERGEYNPSLELAFRLSELFGVPMEAIFSRQPLPPMSAELYSRVPVAEKRA